MGSDVYDTCKLNAKVRTEGCVTCDFFRSNRTTDDLCVDASFFSQRRTLCINRQWKIKMSSSKIRLCTGMHYVRTAMLMKI